MENNATPTTIRHLLIATVALLAVTLLAAGANMYVTLAAPQREVFIPGTVGFEGRLADDLGQAVADGNHTVTFSLYDQAEGGTALWTEQQTVTTHSGLYSVQLGSVDPTNNSLQPSHFDGERWLGVKVGTEDEMTPRIPISSVPFALNAQEAAHAEEADQADQALGLQGNSVSDDAPTDGQVLTWDNAGSEWLPQTIEVPDNFEYPRRASGFHKNSTVVSGDEIICYLIASQLFGHECYQATAADGDSFTTSFLLQEGTYVLHLIGITQNNLGIMDWYVDDVLQASISGQDWYSPSPTQNVEMHDSITVVGDGYHVLKGVVNGKNASSINYHFVLTQWWIVPASD